ncbi:MAG: hypothetical protein RSC93_06240 [Erysipelotrichaceae bacterium]
MNRNQKLKLSIILSSNIYSKTFKFERIKYQIPKAVYKICKMFFILNLILLPLTVFISSYYVMEGNITSIWLFILIYVAYVILYVILYYVMLPHDLENLIDNEK